MIKSKTKISLNSLTEDQKTTIKSLSGVQEFPMRVKCATMAWHTLLSAIESKDKQNNYIMSALTKEMIIAEIKKIYDPEIPVDVYELGLIYNIEIIENKRVNIEMTLTSPNCPVAEELPNEVKDNIKKLEGVSEVHLKIVWDPPWDKDKMSEAAKLELNL